MGNSGHGSPNLNQSRENEIRNDGIQERSEIVNPENQNMAEKEKDNKKVEEEHQNETKPAPEGNHYENQVKEHEIQQELIKKETENPVSNQKQSTQENQYSFEDCNIVNNNSFFGNEVNFYGQNYDQGQNNTGNNENVNKDKAEENQQPQNHFENPFGVIENNGEMEKQEEKK